MEIINSIFVLFFHLLCFPFFNLLIFLLMVIWKVYIESFQESIIYLCVTVHYCTVYKYLTVQLYMYLTVHIFTLLLMYLTVPVHYFQLSNCTCTLLYSVQILNRTTVHIKPYIYLHYFIYI